MKCGIELRPAPPHFEINLDTDLSSQLCGPQKYWNCVAIILSCRHYFVLVFISKLTCCAVTLIQKLYLQTQESGVSMDQIVVGATERKTSIQFKFLKSYSTSGNIRILIRLGNEGKCSSTIEKTPQGWLLVLNHKEQ